MTGFWWVDRVLPGIVSAIIIGGYGYLHLHFNERWPYWGRTRQATRPEDSHDDAQQPSRGTDRTAP